MSDDEPTESGGLELALEALYERLDRLEATLGIATPTPAQARFETWIDDRNGD